MQTNSTGLNPREIKQIVDHTCETLNIVLHATEVIGRFVVQLPCDSVQKIVHISFDGGHRRTEFVRDHGDKRGFKPVQFLKREHA